MLEVPISSVLSAPIYLLLVNNNTHRPACFKAHLISTNSHKPVPHGENLFGKSYQLCRKLFCKQQREGSTNFFGFLSFNTLNFCSHQNIPELAQTHVCTLLSRKLPSNCVEEKYRASFRDFFLHQPNFH